MCLQLFVLLCGSLYDNCIKRDDTLLLNKEEEHRAYTLGTMSNFFPAFPEVQEYLVCKAVFFLRANGLVLYLNEDKVSRVLYSHLMLVIFQILSWEYLLTI